MAEFTHFNESGRARMVDVGAKASTERLATAQAMVFLQPETLEKIQQGKIAKGDVLSVAQVAGVMGAKRTPDLIPMCHPILLTSVDISFHEVSQPNDQGGPMASLRSSTVQAGAELGRPLAMTSAGTVYETASSARPRAGARRGHARADRETAALRPPPRRTEPPPTQRLSSGMPAGARRKRREAPSAWRLSAAARSALP